MSRLDAVADLGGNQMFERKYGDFSFPIHIQHLQEVAVHKKLNSRHFPPPGLRLSAHCNLIAYADWNRRFESIVGKYFLLQRVCVRLINKILGIGVCFTIS